MTREKGKTTTQSKLPPDFGKQEQKVSKEANPAEDASLEDTASSSACSPEQESELSLVKKDIITAIHELKGELKGEFTGRCDEILKAVDEAKTEISNCTERIAQAETRISTVEDDYATLADMVEKLEKRNKALESKVVDMETRSRLNNVRLVNMPEGAESNDPCSFLESWLPDALDMAPLRTPIVLERAHRIGPKRSAEEPPRALIMKFQNYRQKVAVMSAARKKNDILYKNIRVRLYNDLATEVHKQRRQFDSVRQQLRALGLRHGISPPAKLLVTYNEQTYTFDKPSEVQQLINKIQEDNGLED
ncbi:hypothetical protein WMY93_028689 [Mugilogobius chulae]|uniref:L1 transposable element RRM domain-containing protein n=1 Tax=Mugilogobius chulae TaxID=88201 RepID=A0AAW0MQ26_9GOBI